MQNQKETYKASQAINFVEQPDNREGLSPEEQLAAAQSFVAVIDSLNLEKYGGEVLAQNPEKRVRDLYRVLQGDGSYVSIKLEANITSAAEETSNSMPAYEIEMQEIDTNGRGHRDYIYELTRDGTKVIRKDFGDLEEKRKDYIYTHIDTNPNELLDYLEEPISQEVASQDEINKLATLLSHATPVK